MLFWTVDIIFRGILHEGVNEALGLKPHLETRDVNDSAFTASVVTTIALAPSSTNSAPWENWRAEGTAGS